MSADTGFRTAMSDEPRQAVEQPSRWPGWIWAIPIAAVGIVGYLAFQQIAASGPDVTVIFPTGGGIKAGDTKVLNSRGSPSAE